MLLKFASKDGKAVIEGERWLLVVFLRSHRSCRAFPDSTLSGALECTVIARSSAHPSAAAIRPAATDRLHLKHGK